MKNRSKILLGIFILISSLLVGCEDFSDLLIEVEEIVYDTLDVEESESDSQETEVNDSGTYKIEMTEKEITEAEASEAEMIEPQTEENGNQDGALIQVDHKETGYAYQLVPEALKPLYLEMLYILDNHLEDVEISSLVLEEIDYIFKCVLIDYPEFFYVEGYQYTKHTRKDVIKKIIFSGNYSMDKEEADRKKREIDLIVEEFLLGISEEADEYTKVKYTYDYIINTTQYNIEAKDNQNILSVFLYGESVCQGYAKSMQYLLDKLNVESTLVIGKVNTGERHAWNLVKVDGAYYYVDPTWGDASYSLDSTVADVSDKERINYDYLCVTTEQLIKTHQIDNVVSVPKATATAANYYIKEKSYFEIMDSNKMKSLFEKAYDNGERSVTLKCKNQNVYDDIIREMIEKQEIFNYLEGDNRTMTYTYDVEQLTISFWI